MLDTVWKYIEIVTRHAGNLERTHWVILSVIVLGVGVACMRGFGSRNSF
jgi:hypothetical protein